MSGDVTIRSTKPAEKPQELPEAKTEQVTPEQEVSLPYTEDVSKNGWKTLAEEFELGEYWNEDGLYDPELSSIDRYLQKKIADGELGNSRDAIKAEIKNMIKLNKLKDEKRQSVRVGILANYAQFMANTDKVRKDAVKYGY